METTTDHRLSQWLRPEGMICIYIVSLLLVPADYTLIRTLGDVGRPSVIVGLGMFALWALNFLFPRLARGSFTPIRIFVLIFFLAWNTSVAFAYLRGLSLTETAGIERYYLRTVALCGVALYVSEYLVRRVSLEKVLRVLVIAGAVMGAIGVAQFYLDFDLVATVRLPLPLNGEITELATRGSGELARAASTMQHSIEFSVVSAMIFPVAVHLALRGGMFTNRVMPWVVVGFCAAGVPLSVSRSGVIAIVAALVVMIRPWRKEIRRTALIAGVVTIIGLRLTTPGLVGTIVSFFRNVSEDDSISGRTEDYDSVGELFAERPWFGFGAGTFRPEEYFVLDNYILVMLISGGIVGLLALLVLFLGPYSYSVRSGREAVRPDDRNLAFALAGSALAALFTSFTFDSLDFPGFAGMLFLVVGLIGSAAQVSRSPADDQAIDMSHVVVERETLEPVSRRFIEPSDDVRPAVGRSADR